MIGCIVFSRFNSSRFPGKVLADINGRPLLGRVIDRVRVAQVDGPIIVATSDCSADDPISVFAEGEGVEVFRGSLDDVAARALACARHFGLDAFARICGDRPFHCPQVLVQLINLQSEMALDLATNTLIKTYPSGLATEVISTESLEHVLELSQDSLDREHVTRYLYHHPEDFRIHNVEWSSPEDAAIHLALDNEQDLTFICKIMAALPGRPEDASLEMILREAKNALPI